MTAPFSLLMSVYAGDDPEHFERALSSSTRAQTVPPAQVVLVQDGPLGEELEAAVLAAVKASPVPVETLRLDSNRGLTAALTAGLERCEHDIVARMDADDISLPERFARQLPLLEDGRDLVGGGMLEFADEGGKVLAQRTPPVGAEQIRGYARFHQPFSHPTVVFRKRAVLAAGGYQPMGRMEDYWLFARMIAGGAEVDNVAEPVVMYRVGTGAYSRRGGREQWRSEMLLQRAFRRIGFTSRREYLRNVAVRGVYRFVPESLRTTLYRRFIARGGR